MTGPGRSRGFTLIEILVAVTIVAIVLSVAVLSVGVVGDDREVRKEARRFVALFEVATDEALFQGREFGVEFLRSGYRFVEFDPASNQWAAVVGDDVLRQWELPEDITLALRVEQREIVLENEAAVIDDGEDGSSRARDYAPHLLIFSSGEATPFVLSFVREYDDRRVTVQGDLLGNLEIGDDENA
jgi:general secretion pathway protein H